MAAKKATVERGRALIEKVIAKIEAGEAEQVEVMDPRPIAKKVLDKLTFSNGKPLPPSLKRLLEFDASWVMRNLRWFDDVDEPKLEVAPVWRVIKENISDVWHRAYKRLPEPMPQADAIALEVGSESMRMLFLSEPDEAGEYPVIGVDVDDTPIVYFEAPGFDAWLASEAGVVDLKKAPWPAVIKESRTRLFGKKTELDCEFDLEDLSEDEDEAKAEPAKKAKPKKPAAPVVVKEGLSEEKIGKGLAEAIELNDEARIDAYLAAAKERFPKAKVWGSLALREISQSENVELTKRLFAAGVSADAEGPYGAHFETACEYASIEVVKAFLDAGATIDLRVGENKDFALGSAADKKRLDVVKLLLERGAKVNLADDNGMAAIHHAAHIFDQNPSSVFPVTVELVRTLLDHGADIDLQDGNQRTVLHWAIDEGNMPLVEFLVARRANPDLKQWAGDTALTMAVRQKREDMVRLLRAAGARTDIKNNDGWCVDDVAPVGAKGPKELDVKLDCGPGKHKAKLEIEVSIGQALMGTDLMVACVEHFAENGGVGSDVFAPWTGKLSMKGGGLPNYGKGTGKWEITYQDVSAAAFALWLRKILGPQMGYTATKVSLIGDGKAEIDTDRVRAWLGDASLDVLRPWTDPGFPVADKGKGPKRLAWVQTRSALDVERVRAFATGLQLAFSTMLDHTTLAANSFFSLQAGPVSPQGFELQLQFFERNGVFPYDHALARTMTINALSKLHHETDAITGLEWALGVAGDAGSTAPTAAQAGPVEGDGIEISPSGRAACRTCKETIEKGALRFIEADLMGKRFHHLECAAKKLSARLLAALDAYEGKVPDREKLVELASAKKTGGTPGAYPYAEVAKSGRSTCLGCQKAIAKDTLRIAVERQVETPQGTMPRPGYYHLACAKGVETVTSDAVIGNAAGLTDAQSADVKKALD